MSYIPKGANVFVIDLHYVVPIHEVEPHIPGHMQFLEDNYANGRFLASGAKVPRTGGVILAVGRERSEVEELIKADPFHEFGIASYTITEFAPRMAAEGLKAD
ncbi:MAG: hypothetical protein JJ866_20520 [Roseibium sp.]|uniref:YciI family protein n=1 Tax=Roseibium sp. TaxID=1936156 RepID=UPI001B0A5452|nr:YciI family protein [Roseibium sp.]MBO6894339.1 hypothetical protein [Roseibium sp.]MBO6931913.1 hypothetical protein [Roseibium sp.]